MKHKNIIISLLLITSCTQKLTRITFPYIIEDSDIPNIIEDNYINKKQQIVEKGELKYFEYFSLIKPYHRYKSSFETVELYEGKPIGVYNITYYKKGKPFEVKIITYKKGNISEYLIKNPKDSILYKTKFKRGNGYWKDYYYEISTLREEGQVKNNYKYNKWKYYNKTGELDSIKYYKLIDSVDLRYPYCFFNKKEPCYKLRSKNKYSNGCN